MAMIIELNRVTDTTQDDTLLDDVGHPREAEVILFPGVRYERWSEQATEETSVANGNENQPEANRDWLEV